jgi:hypothetical protein
MFFDKIYENYHKNRKQKFLFFIDFKNAYNSINREKLYWLLENYHGISNEKIEIIKFLHYNNKVKLGEVET